MTAERAPRPDAWVGCVVGGEPGVAVVLTDAGEVRASYGGNLLATIARDRRATPQPGDWVVLRRWADNRVTLESRLDRCARHCAPVIDLRSRSRRGSA